MFTRTAYITQGEASCLCNSVFRHATHFILLTAEILCVKEIYTARYAL
jgi:hypothetical protein